MILAIFYRRCLPTISRRVTDAQNVKPIIAMYASEMSSPTYRPVFRYAWMSEAVLLRRLDTLFRSDDELLPIQKALREFRGLLPGFLLRP